MSISTTSGRVGAGQPHRLGAVAGLADHLDVGLGVEQRPEPGPHQRLVVGQQHPDHARSSAVPTPAAPPRACGHGCSSRTGILALHLETTPGPRPGLDHPAEGGRPVPHPGDPIALPAAPAPATPPSPVPATGSTHATDAVASASDVAGPARRAATTAGPAHATDAAGPSRAGDAARIAGTTARAGFGSDGSDRARDGCANSGL